MKKSCISFSYLGKNDTENQKGGIRMEVNMSVEEVVSQISELVQKEGPLGKKQVKKSNPELMKNALYYFPNWDDALKKASDRNLLS